MGRRMLAGGTQRALLAVTVVAVVLSIAPTALAATGMGDEAFYVVLLIDYALLALTTLTLAVLVSVSVVRLRRSRHLGRITAIVAILALPIAAGIRAAITALIDLDAPVAQVLGTLLAVMWVQWVVGALTLAITWLAVTLRVPADR